jgi:plasmid maintenance system antidote protein VapI
MKPEKGQGTVEYALMLALVALVILVMLTMMAKTTLQSSKTGPMPWDTWKKEPVTLTLVGAAAEAGVEGTWQSARDAIAVETGLSVLAVEAMHQNFYNVLAQRLEVESARRELHLLKDHAHLTAWMAIKLALKGGVDVEVYWCPQYQQEHCERYAILLADDKEELCAVAYVKAQPENGTHLLLTSFYRQCRSLRSYLTRYGCIRTFDIRIRIN